VRPKALFAIVESLAREGHGTKRVCRLLRVAPSGFFRWRDQPPSPRAIHRAWLADVIAEIHERSRRTYGWRRVRAELEDGYGQRVNKKLVQSIMHELAISGMPKRRRGRPDRAGRFTAEDFVHRDFHRDGPNQLWMTDIYRAPDARGQGVLLCGARRVVAQGRWMVDRPATDRRDGQRRAWHGDRPTPADERRVSAPRSRFAIDLLDVQPTRPQRGSRPLARHDRRRVRQCCRRVVLGAHANRAPQHPPVEDPRRARRRDVRLDRSVLQPHPSSQRARHDVAHCL
jgi:HTH-like domain